MKKIEEDAFEIVFNILIKGNHYKNVIFNYDLLKDKFEYNEATDTYTLKMDIKYDNKYNKIEFK